MQVMQANATHATCHIILTSLDVLVPLQEKWVLPTSLKEVGTKLNSSVQFEIRSENVTGNGCLH